MNKGNDRTYISTAKVAKELEVPFEVFQWTLEKNRKADNLREGVDYITIKGEMYLTLSGLLWAVARCDGNFRGAVALAEKLATDTETKRVMAAHNELMKKLPEIKEALLLAQETIDTALEDEAPITEEKEEDKKKQYYHSNSKNLPPLNDEQVKWSAEINALLGQKAKETGKMAVHIQRIIYNEMTKKYGIVWDQEKIDTLKRFGLDSHERMTTFRCVCYNDQLRSIFGAMLADFKA